MACAASGHVRAAARFCRCLMSCSKESTLDPQNYWGTLAGLLALSHQRNDGNPTPCCSLVVTSVILTTAPATATG